METENLTINLIPVNTFVFALPDIPEQVVEVSVNYVRDSENHINSEAWLHSSKHKAMMFLADICSFADNGQSEDDIEDRLLSYYNNSETFIDSVSALLAEQLEYFNINEEVS